MSRHDFTRFDSSTDTDSPRRRGRRRFDDDDPRPRRGGRPDPAVLGALDERAGFDIDGPPEGDRWSTWDGAEHGPLPRPDWVLTEHVAVDTELGVLKTGKEADVHLVERAVPGTDRRVLMAAKRYRSAEHRMFHRDAGYLEGRRVRRSRETRAMAGRTSFGRELLSGQWAGAEFAALGALWSAGVSVPYPVQLSGTELLLEFVGDRDGDAAPRLAQLRPEPDQLADLWHQLGEALLGLARLGFAHGDLSAYNLLVHDGRLVLIDLPQVVDVVGNPQGPGFLARDVHRVAEWFAARGLPDEVGNPAELLDSLHVELGIPVDSR
ncbi:serine protein kinase RIO [Pseudonocardia humida]|uniref:non-specific serine/threonine protein kinase n=1 Tax=Pseudonocardia humida TaxID=2800819 RepID=A0ABT0ZUK9_9PSEU|nr:RIO1 family regulatory kinase/ATPase [Pseudonocardia humida]MCO1654420.1 kinase [Pseudonocardia humida]